MVILVQLGSFLINDALYLEIGNMIPKLYPIGFLLKEGVLGMQLNGSTCAQSTSPKLPFLARCA